MSKYEMNLTQIIIYAGTSHSNIIYASRIWDIYFDFISEELIAVLYVPNYCIC